MSVFSTFQESIGFFNSIRYRTNEYYLDGRKINLQEKKIYTPRLHTFYQEELIKESVELSEGRCRVIVKKEAINRFHPDLINNKEFWIECRKSFPLVSVCGAESKNINDVNRQTLQFSNDVGLYPFLMEKLLMPAEDQNVLEIGYGYGNLFLRIKDICNYHGIDYIKPYTLKKYDNLYEINESIIPDVLYEENFFDFVYCVNVFQHCSQKDRFIYMKQAHDVLKPGGYFLFTQFLMTEDNKNNPCWGVVDETGRGFTHFFNQLTECDWEYELSYVLVNLGFKVVSAKISDNFLSMIVQK